jgi:hypothetical protein
MAGILSPSPFQISYSFREPRSVALSVPRRSSGRFQLRRAITFNSGVVGEIRGYRCVRLDEGFVLVLSVRRSDLWFAVNRRISPRLRRGPSSPVSRFHCFQSYFFVFVVGEPQPMCHAAGPTRATSPFPSSWVSL